MATISSSGRQLPRAARSNRARKARFVACPRVKFHSALAAIACSPDLGDLDEIAPPLNARMLGRLRR